MKIRVTYADGRQQEIGGVVFDHVRSSPVLVFTGVGCDILIPADSTIVMEPDSPPASQDLDAPQGRKR